MTNFVLIFCMLVMLSTPALAQGYDYGRRMRNGSSSSRTFAPQPNTNAATPIFSGVPSPDNLPTEYQKGFGQRSHWLERPGASTSDRGTLSQQVDALSSRVADAKNKGDMPGMFQANAALQNLLRQLTSMEPKNAKWKYLQARCYVLQAGGPSRSGTAGDRFSLQQAIRELDMAAACPNASEWMAQILSLRTSTDAELKKRIAKGIEIKQRGARQFAQIYGMRGGGTDNGSSQSWCTVCGHMHASGQCTYRRD